MGSDRGGSNYLPVTVAGQWRTFTAFPSIPARTYTVRIGRVMRACQPAMLWGAMNVRSVILLTARPWTLQELFQRNIGSPEMQNTAFPPQKIFTLKQQEAAASK